MGYVAGVRPPLENAILAAKELRDSKKFLEFLGLVLTIGNYLNAKNPKKLIYGFKLKSLSKLNETKASDGKTTLLQYICEFIANSKDFKELIGLPEDLLHVPAASKIAIGAIEDDVKVMKDGVKQIENYLKLCTGKDKIEGDAYPGRMTEFLEKGKAALETIEAKLAEMYNLMKEMAVLFVVEEKEVMKEPDKFFQDVDQFLELFKGAIKKNDDAKKAEEKKKKQEEEKKKKEEAAAKKAMERSKPKEDKKETEEEGRGLVNDRGNALRDGTLLKKKPKKKTGNDDFDDDSGGKLDSNAINKIF